MTSLLRLFIPVALILTAAFLTGCGSSDSNVVARVGHENITLAEFQDFLDRNPLGYRTADEEFEGKRMLLDSLISHVLLVQGGYEKGIDKSPDVARIVAASRDRFMLDALYETHISSRCQVSEAEIRDTYADLEYQIRAFHILVSDKDTADMIFEKLKAGGNIEQLAYEYSIDPAAKRNRGDMGYFVRGTAPEEFEEVVFDVEVGEITPPFKTGFGYHIVKVVDKKLNEMREEYTPMRPVLKRQLEQYKRDKLTRIYFDSIRTQYQVVLDTMVADYITNKRNVLYPPQVVAQLPKYDFDDDQLDRDEKELILATWDGGHITLIDYLMSVRRWFPPEQRPSFDDYDSLTSVIYTMKQRDILLNEAEKENLQESEYFKFKMKLFERFTVAEVMRNDSIAIPIEPTETEMRDYYDLNREEFLMPAQVHLYEILVSDELLAQRLARDITDLDDFKKKAVMFTERAAMKVKSGDLGYIDNTRSPELYQAAKQTPVGTLGGPIRTRGRFSLIWPVGWTEEKYVDFLTVKEDIIERLQTAAKNEAILKWQKERLENTDVEVFDDVIWSTIDKDFYASSGRGADPS